MTPIHRYIYYMLCSDYWYILRLENDFSSVAYHNAVYFQGNANRQFKTERERRKAFDTYRQAIQHGYDAAKYSEMWPLVVTR